MNQQRMLDEIDVAHKMGVDVFVLDTGWYEKTGDWRVSRDRFPNELKDIKAKLDSYGMKLGLWFNPTVAARSSRMAAEHDDCVRTWKGVRRDPSPVWETEESWDMCLVSRYWQAFADELIRLHDEVGVVYFKWDAIGQYGCSDANHDHGKDENSFQERSECYAFEIGGAMAAVVDKLGEACPEAIVDFDITEGGRTVGLSFLSAGKYFLINNGPYYGNYDIPAPPKRNINMFFYPGPARGWICRAPLTYDSWFPSTLFLTHYFPDDPAGNQWITLASLMLGQNGIWGDLLTITDEGVQRFGEVLARYKVVRDDITAASLVKTGQVGGGLEVYEKISENGRGIVSLFSTSRGEYTYVTKSLVEGPQAWSNVNVHFRRDDEGRAVITATLDKDTAGIVLFGVD
jgi:alpha-galactosidase